MLYAVRHLVIPLYIKITMNKNKNSPASFYITRLFQETIWIESYPDEKM